jgi:hypothetical protein
LSATKVADGHRAPVHMDARELSHVLAGLRLLQTLRQHSADLGDIATDGGAHESMTLEEIDDLCERLNVSRLAEGNSTLPKEVADRLHKWGDKDDLYSAFEEAFLNAYDQDGFTWGERYFYDSETGKAYQTWLALEIEEVDPPDEDTCPLCGGELADATDIPDDAICDVCGWSRSGVRRCVRCGGREDLVPGDAVCARCRR